MSGLGFRRGAPPLPLGEGGSPARRFPIPDSRFPLALLALLLSACGFKPLYQTGEEAGAGLKGVRIGAIDARDLIKPYLEREFRRRAALRTDAAPEYDLVLEVRETAQPLAVQIDDSVTRYNYRLDADYRLTRIEDGKEYRGTADAVASFNVVASQYSTLYAEDSAREKAARALAEDLERDILLKFAADREPGEAAASAARR
jgi:LPS-assembly lipoprotein